jgi:hypothetical protein
MTLHHYDLNLSSFSELPQKHMTDAKIQAFRHPLVNFTGGIVFNDCETDAPFRHLRFGRPVDHFVKDLVYADRLKGSYIYAGAAYHHFGHVMAEMVHRILPSIKIAGNKPLLFVNALNETTHLADMPIFFKDILKFLNVCPNAVTIINSDTVVDDLLVVQQASNFGQGPVRGYTEALRDFSVPRLQTLYGQNVANRKIYVSKSRIAHGGRFLGERYLETLLEEEGFETIHPQELEFAKQLHLYSQAKIVIFSEGSACHGTELLGKDNFEVCGLLGRRPSHLKIFRNALSPRSREYHDGVVGAYIGSAITRRGENTPLDEFGVSVFCPHELTELLKKIIPGNDIKFDRHLYAECAHVDLDKYIAHCRAITSPIVESSACPGLVNAFRNRIETTVAL